jgi:hypothetical protein
MKCINLSPAALLLLLNCCVVNAQEYHNAGENIERRGAEDAKDTMPDIMKIVVGCFVGAFILMVAFFCVKIYADFKERNRPIEDRGPFGTMREVNVSLLTPCQRRAVLEVLFSNDKCMVYHDEVSTDFWYGTWYLVPVRNLMTAPTKISLKFTKYVH